MGKKLYDWDAVAKDYTNGLSLNKLCEKYGMCRVTAFKIVHKKGKMRSMSDARILANNDKIGEWHKLVRVNKSVTRFLSVPAGLLIKIGCNPKNELKGKWSVEGNNLILTVVEKEGK